MIRIVLFNYTYAFCIKNNLYSVVHFIERGIYFWMRVYGACNMLRSMHQT